jgi:hypothetical protein
MSENPDMGHPSFLVGQTWATGPEVTYKAPVPFQSNWDPVHSARRRCQLYGILVQ